MTKQPETPIRTAVRSYLRLRGWFVFFNQQGLGSYSGISDLIAVKDGNVVFIEIKTPTGKQSDKQKGFQSDIESHGGCYRILRSLEDAIQFNGEFK